MAKPLGTALSDGFECLRETEATVDAVGTGDTLVACPCHDAVAVALAQARVHATTRWPSRYQARGVQQSRRRVSVLVHRAYFQVPDSPLLFFIKVTNLSPHREIELTHIWFATEPEVYVLNQARPLPARLRLDETFETWMPVD